MMRPKILNLEPESEKAQKILESFGDLTCDRMSRDALLSNISEYDAVLVRLAYSLDSEILEQADHLEAIGTSTTGLTHIDTKLAKQNDISILSLRGEREFLEEIYASSEHTWVLVMTIMRNVPSAVQHVHSGGWDKDQFRGDELHGKSLGIVGYGRNGTKVANFARAFGMEVLVYDPYLDPDEYAVEFTEFDELLTRSDVVSLHVPLNNETRHMIGESELDRLDSNSYLVNTTRGEVIDESALVSALEHNRIKGAALDVLSDEHTSSDSDWTTTNELIEYSKENDNLVITPHIGGMTHQSIEKTEEFIANKMKEYFVE